MNRTSFSLQNDPMYARRGNDVSRNMYNLHSMRVPPNLRAPTFKITYMRVEKTENGPNAVILT